MTLLVIAIAPSVALFLFFYLRDKYEKEPLRLLLRVFIFGALMTIPAGILEYMWMVVGIHHDSGNLALTFVFTFFVIGITEEGMKYLVVKKVAYRDVNFNEPYDGIMYSVMASLGFATLENLGYVLPGGIHVGISRAVLAVPGHALFGVLMGYYIGLAKFTDNHSRRKKYLLAGLGLAVVTHGAYDFFLMGESEIKFLPILVLPLLILCWIYAYKATRLHAEGSPFSESKGKK